MCRNTYQTSFLKEGNEVNQGLMEVNNCCQKVTSPDLDSSNPPSTFELRRTLSPHNLDAVIFDNPNKKIFSLHLQRIFFITLMII